MLSEPEFVAVPLRVVGWLPAGWSLVPCAKATELPTTNDRRRRL